MYCRSCHPDAYEGWFHSVHHFSFVQQSCPIWSTVRETRDVSLGTRRRRQGVPFVRGLPRPGAVLQRGLRPEPDFDDIHDPTAQAGITCTACHAITHVNSTAATLTTRSKNRCTIRSRSARTACCSTSTTSWCKAKPSFHKQTFLKPLHKTAEFCSACHKVASAGLAEPLQGIPARPEPLRHVPAERRIRPRGPQLLLSREGRDELQRLPHAAAGFGDFGAKLFDGTEHGLQHSRPFVPRGQHRPCVPARRDRNRRGSPGIPEGVMRVDLFGIKEGGTIDGPLIAPLRPARAGACSPAERYLLEMVMRTLKMGHLFTAGHDRLERGLAGRDGDQRRADSRPQRRPWMTEGRGRSAGPTSSTRSCWTGTAGASTGATRRTSSFRSYNHQIPPGAGQVVHYALDCAAGRRTAPVVVEVKLQYRKFDQDYMQCVSRGVSRATSRCAAQPGRPYVNDAADHHDGGGPRRVPRERRRRRPSAIPSGDIPAWQRWNDYGIGLLLEGRSSGGKGELRQAAEAFAKVEELSQYRRPLEPGAGVLHRRPVGRGGAGGSTRRCVRRRPGVDHQLAERH